MAMLNNQMVHITVDVISNMKYVICTMTYVHLYVYV